MKKNIYLLLLVPILLLAVGGFIFIQSKKTSKEPTSVTPTPALQAEQLPVDKQPQVSLQFSADGHYVTVDIKNIHSDQLEYNLIYDATVKNNQIQTGVNSSTKLNGETTYTARQLLGSESSGKFTYHQNISNAVMELALRDSQNRSVFSGTYPFTVQAGSSVELSLQ